ncbi:hypothetical protein IMZ48_45020, partial [Candidatus Bathyarchaeota archaeon]|nr:hypothetical protein [Candidatus Bathyarchaeota archaeon]
VLCALSGINTHADVQMCLRDGVDAVLVGEAIMRAPDASVFIHQLCAGSTATPQPAAADPLLVKICGTRSAEAARAAVEAGADLVGVCLVPGAKRCISHETALEISRAVHSVERRNTTEITTSEAEKRQIATDFFEGAARRLATSGPKLAGIFQNQPLAEILEKTATYGLDVVQLHGDEPVEWARLIPVPVIRCFKPGQVGAGSRGYHAVPLLDSGSGSGKLLDVSRVREALEGDSELRVILAGGLDPENVAEAVGALGELSGRVVGVDVSSGVEVDGRQDVGRIRKFVEAGKAFR